MNPFATCLRALSLLLALIAAPVAAQTIEVTTLNDSGAGSLRQAISDAVSAPGTEITFADGLSGTILLSSELHIIRDLTITGPGADVLAIDGGGTVRHFFIEQTYTTIPIVQQGPVPNVTISGLTLQNGRSSDTGGSIRGSGCNLTVTDAAFVNNIAAGGTDGGAIAWGSASFRTFRLDRVLLTGNRATGYGGALSVGGPVSVDVINSTFYGNIGDQGGGAIVAGLYSSSAAFRVTSSTIVGNRSVFGGGGGFRLNNSTEATVLGSIVAQNAVPSNWSSTKEFYVASTTASYSTTHSLLGDEATGLGTLSDNEGPTQTFSLLEGSSALDAIPEAECPTDVDQRGSPALAQSPVVFWRAISARMNGAILSLL